MTTTLTSAEYETKTLTTRVQEWTERYAATITENYRLYHTRQGYTDRENLMRFKVESGRKYYKIIQQDFDTFQNTKLRDRL